MKIQGIMRALVATYVVAVASLMASLLAAQSTYALTPEQIAATKPTLTNPTNGAVVTGDFRGNQMLDIRWTVPNSALVNNYLVTIDGFTYTTSIGLLYMSNFTQGVHTVTVQSVVGASNELGGSTTASFTMQNARPLSASLTISNPSVSWGTDGRLKFNGNFRDTKFVPGTVSIILSNDKGVGMGASAVNLAYTSAGQDFSGTVTGDDRIVAGNTYAIEYYGYNQLTRFDPAGSVIEQSPRMFYCFRVEADRTLMQPVDCPAAAAVEPPVTPEEPEQPITPEPPVVPGPIEELPPAAPVDESRPSDNTQTDELVVPLAPDTGFLRQIETQSPTVPVYVVPLFILVITLGLIVVTRKSYSKF